MLQAELFNELHRWVRGRWRSIQLAGGSSKEVPRYYAMIRDFFKAGAPRSAMRSGQGKLHGHQARDHQGHGARLRRPAREDGDPEQGRVQRWEQRLGPWGEMARQFREEGFYERFPAKGEVERVARIHRDLARAAGIETKKS